MFDSHNKIHLCPLQFVYLPQVNDSLAELSRDWNYHGLTTENNTTPRQLWITGMLSNSRANYRAVSDVLEDNQPDMSGYGIEEEGDVPELQTCNNVVVPESPIETTDEQNADLQQILETTDDDEHCIEKYLAVLDYMEHFYQNSNDELLNVGNYRHSLVIIFIISQAFDCQSTAFNGWMKMK